MKKLYVNPSLEVVAIQQRGQMLSGSIDGVNSNVGIQYGGGGNGTGSSEPMAREFEFEEEFEDESFDD
jgi:hypothetical protein